jgi:predicted  nucleic acid-binding Zn-ribbon protein
MSSAIVQEKLRARQEQIRKEIRTTMKMKEGTEKMMRAATDRKVLTSAQNIIKEANAKLADLASQLQEVDAYLITSTADVEEKNGGRF